MISSNLLITQYDEEIEQRCSILKLHSENLINNMLCSLDIALSSIPESIRKLPLKVLMEDFNGDLEKAIQNIDKINKFDEKKSQTPNKKNQIKQNKKF